MSAPAPDAFLQYFVRIRHRTDRVVACIPPDRLEWTHRDGAFTFGDLVRHIAAAERYMFAENAALRPSLYPGHGRELADGFDAVMAFKDRLHAETMDILGALDAEGFARRCTTPGGASVAVWKWLRAMVEHEVHHRGQLYLMLAMIGVDTPPLYGLTAEDVRERSLAGPGPRQAAT